MSCKALGHFLMESITVFIEHPEAWPGSDGPWDYKEGGCTLWESPCVWRGESIGELYQRSLYYQSTYSAELFRACCMAGLDSTHCLPGKGHPSACDSGTRKANMLL